MTLRILKKKSVYHLKVAVLKPNVTLLLNYFLNKIDKKKKVTLNIEETNMIDKNGLNAIKQLMVVASTKQKNFSIVEVGVKKFMTILIPIKSIN